MQRDRSLHRWPYHHHHHHHRVSSSCSSHIKLKNLLTHPFYLSIRNPFFNVTTVLNFSREFREKWGSRLLDCFLIFFFFSCSGMRLCLCGPAVCNGQLAHCPDGRGNYIKYYWVKTDKVKYKLWESKPVLVPHFTHHIPHEILWQRSVDSAVERRRLTSRVITESLTGSRPQTTFYCKRPLKKK
jgi:hypothetical protein